MDESYTALQQLFLARLERMAGLAALEQTLGNDLWLECGSAGESHFRLLRRALFSNYLDCLEQGVDTEARVILGEMRGAGAGIAGR